MLRGRGKRVEGGRVLMGWWREVGVLEYEHFSCRVRLDSIIISFITKIYVTVFLFFLCLHFLFDAAGNRHHIDYFSQGRTALVQTVSLII